MDFEGIFFLAFVQSVLEAIHVSGDFITLCERHAAAVFQTGKFIGQFGFEGGTMILFEFSLEFR